MKKYLRIKLLLLIILLQYSCLNITVKPRESKKVKNKCHGECFEADFKGDTLMRGIKRQGLKSGLWKGYKNDTLISVEKFMNDTLQFQLDKDDYIYEKIYLEKISSCILVPENWEINTEFDNKKNLLTAVKDCNTSKVYCSNIILRHDDLTGHTYKDYVLNNREQMLKETGNEIASIEEIDFKSNKGKYEAFQAMYLIKMENNIDLVCVMVWFNYKDKVINFMGTAEESEINTYLLLFSELGNSLTENE